MILSALSLAAATVVAAPCDLKQAPAEFERQQGVECGWVAVPLRPGSAKSIRLWTARVRATGSAKKEDPILYINGGPGIATIDSIIPGLPTSKTMGLLRQHRDVILFDQRGTGRSEQSLCPGLAKTLNAVSAAGLSPEWRRNAAVSPTRPAGPN